MRSIILVLIAISSFYACDNSKNEPQHYTEIQINSLSLTPNWEDHFSLLLELKKSRNNIQNDTSRRSETVSEIELDIKKLENGYWDCNWRYLTITPPNREHKLTMKLIELSKRLEYNFILDSSGVFSELKNWEEIQAVSYEMIETLSNDLNTNSDSVLLDNPIINNIKNLYATKESIELYLMQEAQLYFALGGLKLHKNDTVKDVSFINVPLMNGLVKQNTNIVLDAAYSDSSANVHVTQFFDESQLRSTIENGIGTLAGKEKEEEAREELKGVSYDLYIDNYYNFSIETGLANQIIAEKYIKVGDRVRIDRIEITMRGIMPQIGEEEWFENNEEG